MVFYFHPQGWRDGADDYLIYMGKDKYENEDLIRYGLPSDVWFHVDDMSSAHVYLRLPEDATLDDIPPATLEDCCQLVKQNSIQGCKLNNVVIVYTMWANLKKTASMDVGQVGFHDGKAVRKYKVDRKASEVINRLEKTREERHPDLAAERQAFDTLARSKHKAEERAQRQAEKADKEEQRRMEELRSYKNLMQTSNMVSNEEIRTKYTSVEEAEDDFM